MVATLLPAEIIEPKNPADACVIWLHGLGADGHDFVDAVPSLGLENSHSIRFIFPHAPMMPITMNGGMVMPAWYDIGAIDLRAAQDEAGIKNSEQAIWALIDEQLKQGVKSERIILAGFSQGGAVALHTALRYPKPLAGAIVLSSYLPLHDLLAKEKHSANEKLKIFMAHGFMDSVVSYWIGQQSCTHLQTAGFIVDWHSYPMAHTVSLSELHDIGAWIKNALN
ncbi:MAG: alpha/beta hydrolase [Candidatus Berkiella sp.]